MNDIYLFLLDNLPFNEFNIIIMSYLISDTNRNDKDKWRYLFIKSNNILVKEHLLYNNMFMSVDVDVKHNIIKPIKMFKYDDINSFNNYIVLKNDIISTDVNRNLSYSHNKFSEVNHKFTEEHNNLYKKTYMKDIDDKHKYISSIHISNENIQINNNLYNITFSNNKININDDVVINKCYFYNCEINCDKLNTTFNECHINYSTVINPGLINESIIIRSTIKDGEKTTNSIYENCKKININFIYDSNIYTDGLRLQEYKKNRLYSKFIKNSRIKSTRLYIPNDYTYLSINRCDLYNVLFPPIEYISNWKVIDCLLSQCNPCNNVGEIDGSSPFNNNTNLNYGSDKNPIKNTLIRNISTSNVLWSFLHETKINKINRRFNLIYIK